MPSIMGDVREVVRLKNSTVVSDGGRLYVGKREVDPTQPVALLPLLEVGPEAIPSSTIDELPVNQILALALTWSSADDWWPRHAIAWLSKTGIPPDVMPALEDFAHSQRGTQASRHAARRLLKAAG
jgi:hypothetical protein